MKDAIYYFILYLQIKRQKRKKLKKKNYYNKRSSTLELLEKVEYYNSNVKHLYFILVFKYIVPIFD